MDGQRHGRPRVLMIGPALDVKGGVSSVETLLLRELGPSQPVAHVATLVDGPAWRKLLAAVRGLAAFLWLRAVFRPRIAHIHFASRASFWRKSVFVLLARATGLKVIGHAHGAQFDVFFDRESGPRRRAVIRWILGRMHAVVTISSWWQDYYRRIGVANTVLIPNPVPVDARTSRADGDEPMVLVLGRLGERKGTYDLLRAIPRVLERAPRARFVLAGDGDVDEIRRRVASEPWSAHVSVPGWVDAAGRDQLLSLASVFVLPSYNEGLPMGMLEAMAAGLPVVGTTVGGIPELIEPGANGFLVAPGDVPALADALATLAADGELRRRFGGRSRAVVLERYELGLVARRLRDVYDDVANGRAAATPALA